MQPPVLRTSRSWFSRQVATTFTCAGLQVEDPEVHKQRLAKLRAAREETSSEEEDDDTVVEDAFALFRNALRQARQDCILDGAALTGGDDTRLVLACCSTEDRDELIFQTHGKQPTDLRIAKWFARHLSLRHKEIQPVQNVRKHSDMLHEKIPLRQRQRRSWKQYLQDVPTHKIHGRFGTELMGFLCYDKTSAPYRCLEDLTEVTPRLTRLFRSMFQNPPQLHSDESGVDRDYVGENSSTTESTVRNPVHTLE